LFYNPVGEGVLINVGSFFTHLPFGTFSGRIEATLARMMPKVATFSYRREITLPFCMGHSAISDVLV